MTALLVLAGLSLGVFAEEHAVCSNPDFLWSSNSLHQSPCQIGEALGNDCASDGSFNIQPIPEGYHYSGIAFKDATKCVCNHVYWSLLSVCAACQGGGTSAFESWAQNCTETYGSYPSLIPDGTAVPHYAYLPLLANGMFNVTAASTDQGPEATSGTEASSTSQTSSSTSLGSQSTTSASSSSGGGSSNAGPIAGGVVGGIVGLALIATAIFVFLRRRKRDAALEPVLDLADNSTESAVYPFIDQQPMMTGSQSRMAHRVYDPNGPSAFPPSTSPLQGSAPPPYASPIQGPTRAQSHKPNVRVMSAATTYRGNSQM